MNVANTLKSLNFSHQNYALAYLALLVLSLVRIDIVKRYFNMTLASIFFCLAGPSSAQINLMTNGDFEDNKISSGWKVFQQLDGREAVSGAGIEVQSGNTGGIFAHSGSNKIELDSHTGRNGGTIETGSNTIMAQQLNNLEVGAYYEFSFWYNGRPSVRSGSDAINIFLGDDSSFIFGDAEESVFDNKVGWQEFGFSLQANSESMILDLGATDIWNSSGDSLGAYIDDISLVTASVPEPASVLLLGVGLSVLMLSRRRQRDF